MRGLGSFFGTEKRNRPVKLVDPRPVPRYPDNVHTGNVGLDGFELLSKADPDRAGSRPFVHGTEGPVFRGPDDSFEQ
jgi:hypothetical protein